MSTANHHHHEPKPTCALPDAAVCRAGGAGIADLVYCLISDPVFCEHRLSFGSKFFCLHPRRDEIVSRSARSG